jgi:cytochrome c-type biogenesis protein CcmF
MSKIEYIGEHLWVGQIGHFAILLSFIAALFAAFSFYKSQKAENSGWLSMGRWGFIVHALSLFAIITTLLYAMYHKMYEYSYVQRQVSDELPIYYLFSSFWQGQEGSFILWMFWHVILGLILIRTAHKWEPFVLATLSGIQAFLMSMLMGIYIPFTENQKIGSNPFALIRDTMDAPIFANADYLSLITGTGLNPLLQNYWMVIHPPVLFLGFASVTIPFCFAIAGLTSKEHKEWLRPAMKWASFSGFIYGLGILMGAAWAYEALSFGGYWAWDPVENSSLVPWLLVVAGIHTHLIAKSTGRAIGSTYIYYGLAFLFVLYSTFLTRSGILGDTSVHAFTEMGLENQLILFMLTFSALPIYLYVKNRKSIPKTEKEEAIYSREFWMFIGSMVLLFSGVLMTVSTSLPVFNKIMYFFDNDYIGHVITDQMDHHNKYQLWIGVFIGILSSLSLLLRFKEFNWDSYRLKFFKSAAIIAGLTAISTFVILPQLNTTSWHQGVLLFSGILAVITNIYHVFLFGKGNQAKLASFMSHFGFGLLILGILISGLNKRHISTNPFAQQGITADSKLDKVVTLIKERKFFLNDYWVTYESDTLEGNLRKFDISFANRDENNHTRDSFTVRPSAIYSNDFRKIEVWNPSTKRYLHKDIFTQVSGYPAHLLDIEVAHQLEDSLDYIPYSLKMDEPYEHEDFTLTLKSINYEPDLSDGDSTSYDMGIGLNLEFISKKSAQSESYIVEPALGLKNALVYQFPKSVDDLGIKIKVDDQLFSSVFQEEVNLEFESIVMKEGESREWNGYTIELKGFDRTPSHRNYSREEGDIALGAILSVQKDGISSELAPIFVIRNSQQFSIKDYAPVSDIHARFSSIDPNKGEMTFSIAKGNSSISEYPIVIAEDVPRSDILVLEAQVFPGINLVWSGSLLMLFGFLVSLLKQRRQKS